MRRRWSLLFLFFAAACQGAPPAEGPSPPPAQPLPPPSASATPTASAATLLPTPAPSAAPPASVEAPPAASATLPPYPDAWRKEAEMTNISRSCSELVYKRGCAEIRTGRVTAEVTLKPDGQVQRVELIENGIHRDPEVVWRCLRGKLPHWNFRPPEGVSPTVRVTVVLSDRC